MKNIRDHHDACASSEIWNGGACIAETHFVNNCSGLALALERQEHLLRAAEAAQQSACTAGPGQECSGLTNMAQSQLSLYQTLQERYQRCMRESTITFRSHSRPAWNYSQGFVLDSSAPQLDLP